MKVALCGALVSILGLAGVVGAGAQSPKVRQMMEREEKALAADIADTNRICDPKIAVKVDWSAAPVGETERAEPGTALRYCDQALKGI